jgi:hypothetical protein
MDGIRSLHRFTFPRDNTICGYATSDDTNVVKTHHPKPEQDPGDDQVSTSRAPGVVVEIAERRETKPARTSCVFDVVGHMQQAPV